jgi:hypothetical protein
VNIGTVGALEFYRCRLCCKALIREAVLHGALAIVALDSTLERRFAFTFGVAASAVAFTHPDLRNARGDSELSFLRRPQPRLSWRRLGGVSSRRLWP